MTMRRLVGVELRKLLTVRLWVWLLLAATAITALVVSLQIAFADDPDTWTRPLHTIPGQRTLLAAAASASAPLAAVLGATGAAGEFRHSTAIPTISPPWPGSSVLPPRLGMGRRTAARAGVPARPAR